MIPALLVYAAPLMAAAADTAAELHGYLRKAEAIGAKLSAQHPRAPSFTERLALVRQYIQ